MTLPGWKASPAKVIPSSPSPSPAPHLRWEGKNLRKLQTPDIKHKPVGQEMSSSPSRKPELLSSVVAVLADQHSVDLQPMINNKNLLISALLSLNSRKHAALRDIQMEIQSTQSTLTGTGVSLLRFILPVLQIISFLCLTVHLHCTILSFLPKF